MEVWSRNSSEAVDLWKGLKSELKTTSQTMGLAPKPIAINEVAINMDCIVETVLQG